MDEPLFGLGVQVEVLKDELCDIDPEDENMPNCSWRRRAIAAIG